MVAVHSQFLALLLPLNTAPKRASVLIHGLHSAAFFYGKTLMLLSELKTNSAAIQDGIFVKVPGFPGLEIKTRGYTDEYIDARNRMNREIADQNGGTVSNAQARKVNAELLKEYLLLDVKGLFNGPGPEENPVTVDHLKTLLDKPEYSRLARACWAAVGAVQVAAEKQTQDAEGNSPAQ